VDAIDYEAWRPRLQRFCSRLLGNAHDAEEVVQDVFARLVATGDRYRLDRDVDVLLFRMARNRCADLRRKHRPESHPDVNAAVGVTGGTADVDEAIATLPFAQREVLLLTAVDGLSYREAAAILGCSIGTVAARKYAAVAALRTRLEP
jgi:RNA polymerase sigma-70 factor, ECF subfamily